MSIHVHVNWKYYFTFILPSIAAILFDAIPFIYIGLSPLGELIPPTILNPRLSFPSLARVIVYSRGLLKIEKKKMIGKWRIARSVFFVFYMYTNDLILLQNFPY